MVENGADLMRKNSPDLAQRLEPFMANIAEYRATATVLAALAAQQSHQVSDEALVRVEEISDDVRSDIARLADLIGSLGSPAAADLALTAEVEDALRLVLLEITETGTRLYSVRSAVS